MTYLAILFAVWVVLLGALLWLALGVRPGDYYEPPAAAPDPYEGEMQKWRRAVHDWTRDN